MRVAALVALSLGCAACARTAVPATARPDAMPRAEPVDACHDAIAAALLDDVRTRRAPDRDPSYLLDLKHAATCAGEAEGLASHLVASGHDAFPWDPSFGRRRCVATGLW